MSILDAVGVPAGWRSVPFGRVASRTKDTGRPDLEPLSVFLGAGVVPRHSREDNHNQLGEDLGKYLVVGPGDLVFNKLRTWQGGLGASSHEGIVSPAYFVCRPDPDYNSRFLQYLLLSSTYLQELKRVSKWQPPSQFDIGWEQLRTIPIVAPGVEQQRAIADFLDTETARIDALIAKKQRMIDGLLERREVTTALGVAGEILGTPASASGLTWLPSIPTHWRTAKLTLVARLGSGHTPSRNQPEWWVDCTIPWVTTGEVAEMRSDRQEYVTDTRERISELGIANSSAVVHPAGTVVLCRTASAGYSAIMATDMATSQDFAAWTCGPLLRPRYLLLCLRAMRSDLLGRLAMGSTHKTIYMPDIEAIRIPLPPLGEQDAIVDQVWERLLRIDQIVDTTQRQIGLLRERRQALVTAAVTGELEVPGVAT